MYLYMLAHPDFDKFDLSSLRVAVVGGQSMPASKSMEWQKRCGVPILELWGMTELAGPGIMQHSYCENRLGSVGIMMPFMQGRIADPLDASKTLADGEVGELMVKGPIEHARLLGQRGGDQGDDRAGRLAAYRRSLHDGRGRRTSSSSTARRT